MNVKNILNGCLLVSFFVSFYVFSSEKSKKSIHKTTFSLFLNENKYAAIGIGSLSVLLLYILLNRQNNDKNGPERQQDVNIQDQTNSTNSNIFNHSKENNPVITQQKNTSNDQKFNELKADSTISNTSNNTAVTDNQNSENNQQINKDKNQKNDATVIDSSNGKQQESKKIMPEVIIKKIFDESHSAVAADFYKDFIKTGFFALDDNNKINFTIFNQKNEKQILLNKILLSSFSSDNKDLISAVICSLGTQTKQCYFDALIGDISKKTYFGEHQIKIIESLLDQHGCRWFDDDSGIKKSKHALVPNNPYDISISDSSVVLSLKTNSSALLKSLIRYVQKTAPENLYSLILQPRENIWLYFREYYDETNILTSKKLKSVNQRIDHFKQKYPAHRLSMSLLLELNDEKLISLCKYEAKNIFANNASRSLNTIFDPLNFYSMEFIQSRNTISEIKKKIQLLFEQCPLEASLLMQHTQACDICDGCNKNPSHGMHTFFDLVFSKKEKNEILKNIEEITNKKNNELRIINSYNLDSSCNMYKYTSTSDEKMKPLDKKLSSLNGEMNISDYF